MEIEGKELREEEREEEREDYCLFCMKCGSQREVIVDRRAKGEIIFILKGGKTTTKPIHRSRLCYYHNRKEEGRFGGQELRRGKSQKAPKTWLPGETHKVRF